MPGGPGLEEKFPNLQGSTQDSDSFDLYRYLGDSWAVIMLHPQDFTSVCTTELAEVALRADEFTERGVKVVGFSCNNSDSHRRWIQDIEHLMNGHKFNIPLFCDPDRETSVSLGVLHPSHKDDAGLPVSVRGLYVLRPDKKIALTMTYPSSTGRNFSEVIRTIDSLQMTVNMSVATPVGWTSGNDVIVNDPLTDAQADQVFGKAGYRIEQLPSERGQDLKKHYLRWTKDPSEYPPEGNWRD